MHLRRLGCRSHCLLTQPECPKNIYSQSSLSFVLTPFCSTHAMHDVGKKRVGKKIAKCTYGYYREIGERITRYAAGSLGLNPSVAHDRWREKNFKRKSRATRTKFNIEKFNSAGISQLVIKYLSKPFGSKQDFL